MYHVSAHNVAAVCRAATRNKLSKVSDFIAVNSIFVPLIDLDQT